MIRKLFLEIVCVVGNLATNILFIQLWLTTRITLQYTTLTFTPSAIHFSVFIMQLHSVVP